MKKHMVIAILVGYAAGLPTLAQSQPSVTDIEGTVDRNHQLTIVGAAFGAKPTASPFRWDDFQNGTPGQLLRSSGESGGSIWDLQSHPGRRPYYTAETAYDSRTGQQVPGYQRYSNDICAMQNFYNLPDGIGTNRAIAVIDQPSTVWYVSMWVYREDYAGTAYNTDNAKIWSHMYSSGWGGTPVDLRWVANGLTSEISAVINHCPSDGFQELGRRNGLYEPTIGRWVRMETFVDMGNPGQPNGYFATAYDGKLSTPSGNPREFNGILTPAGCSPTPIGSWITGNYFRETNGAVLRQYISEIYVDHTFARVEIGNAPTWAACTHREVQIPSSWSSNSITINVNVGAFNPNADVYLYVVDAGRQTSVGYPLVIGHEYQFGDPGSPGAPGAVIFE